MRVVVNNNTYGMNKSELDKLLVVASKQVPFGIYAIEKNDYCELRKDTFENADELEKHVAEFEKQGFKVHYNNKRDLRSFESIVSI